VQFLWETGRIPTLQRVQSITTMKYQADRVTTAESNYYNMVELYLQISVAPVQRSKG